MVCILLHFSYVQLSTGRNGQCVVIKAEQYRLMGRIQLFSAVLLYHAQRLCLIGPANQGSMANVRHNTIDLMGDCLALTNLWDIQNCPLNVKEINRLAT